MNSLPVSPAVRARYHVVHETQVNYASTVTLSQQYLHMTPRSFSYQQIESHALWVTPTENDGVDGMDYFGNQTRQITITAAHQSLLVHAESTVALMQRPDLDSIQKSASWESLRDRLQQGMETALADAYRYLYASPHVSCSLELEAFARISFTPGRAQLDAALDLTQRIFDEFDFDADATDISTPLDEVLRGRRGVCQDFAQLMIGCLRSLGLPARYMSGYILTHPPAGQPRMIGADASHAWVSVFCPDLGWVDFDPTNRCLVQHEHITLGWGRDFSDVTPMRGVVLGGGEQELEVRVTVTPLPLNGLSGSGNQVPAGFPA
ncbi:MULTISPECIES: transglutaminase family protein [unclassified Polaromonas]|uniref:transglutaminase family protein n=1 Tax=unclassified Polaromonas TaxID=2638319 RepID=UPI0018CA8DAF|nr:MULTISPECIES: transglutaminase family protein [unclassified Polaromonas]MBG6073816.1 transglutaminase-like putative cysteine protease [Polaromonas sp. CG_9.7]MBG6115882.1 transglutaminase-like putative cysteine protease [Polaromonas sp. CG_9.2]MDH6185965.1 transglutaminase-like putative cysteine protease [Polaromonas sp. CG_23.6]